MALPVSHAPRSSDVATTGWAALTVRVAWTLRIEGINVTPEALRDARDHALLHLEPTVALPEAEDRAEALTRAFVARARGRRSADPWPQDAVMPLSLRWRRALERSLSPLPLAVFRQHYGDGRPLDDLERALQVDRIALEGARGGLREVVRQAGCADGLPLEEWPNERLDGLLRRLAAYAPDACPSLAEVQAGEHRAHAQGCARCTRMLRLLKARVLDAEDLEPPLGRARPAHQVTLLVLHFHPTGRHHRRALAAEATVSNAPVGDDLLVLDFSDPEPVKELLELATEVRAPSRDHVRGVLCSGPGRWSVHGVLGPLVEEAERLVRARGWGSVEGLGELPDPLPQPPAARALWAGVAALAVAAALLVPWAIVPPRASATGLHAEFSPGRGGLWTAFDVDDAARVALVREREGQLDLVLHAHHPADKASLATGDGAYRLHTAGTGILLVASHQPIPELTPLLAAAAEASDPLGDLAARIRQTTPRADVAVGRRP